MRKHWRRKREWRAEKKEKAEKVMTAAYHSSDESGEEEGTKVVRRLRRYGAARRMAPMATLMTSIQPRNVRSGTPPRNSMQSAMLNNTTVAL